MLRQIRAEFIKLFTTRATYVFLAFALVILVFFAFYVDGYHVTKAVTDPHKLYTEVISATNFLALLFALAGVLLVANEYRYNTIMYTLTASNNRLKVLLAKIIVVSVFTVIAALVFGALSPLLAAAGLHLKGIHVVAQTIPVWDTLWRVAFYAWAYAMLAIIIAFIIRNQVGTIITVILFPGTVEALLGLLLKDNVKYLPFTALGGVLSNQGVKSPLLSHGNSALLVCGYVVVTGVVATILFVRRDAN